MRDALKQCDGIEGFKVARQGVQVGHGQQMQIIDQCIQLQHLFLQGLQGGRGGGVDAVDQRVNFPAQHRERCAQFMRHVGYPLTSARLKLLQAFGHAVDVAHGVAQFIRALCLQSCVQLALRNLLGGGLNLKQRPHHLSCRPTRHPCGYQQQSSGHDQHALVLRG